MVDNWISVKDRLPKHGQKVKMFEPEYAAGGLVENGVYEYGNFNDGMGDLNDGVVVKWKPLPEPPIAI